MEIKKDVENKLLNRREIEVFLEDSGATLRRNDVKVKLAKMLKVDEKLIIVERLGAHFGNSNMKIEAYVYTDEKALKSTTEEHMIKRNVIEQKTEAVEGEN